MMIDGKWRENISCKHCRYRHPADVTCAEAKLVACKTAAERADKAAAEKLARDTREAEEDARPRLETGHPMLCCCAECM